MVLPCGVLTETDTEELSESVRASESAKRAVSRAAFAELGASGAAGALPA